MISEEQLNEYRLDGTKIRVIRDEMPENDVRGIIVAWDETHVMVRRANRRIVKLSRSYRFEAAALKRSDTESN
ncbi:hypothetical protein IDH44_22125 [Paenibacillus sp. IB182496]|uniref:Uncharacterized protein n=1 Tax=Paenibacillus sabuli TaxID=2772509 RepID=A0A927BW22_9BACL|nr:hypothetical protein [Paenibacillus sabuli]MBD2847902.1 hypothetical protein [Paenibacillus sabuli]